MNRVILPARSLSGSIRVPSDKSIAHRAAIVGSLASGTSRIRRYPRGADTISTIHCMRQLGVEFEWDADTLVVHGCGLDGLRAPSHPLDCGNSGTTMRLLTGLLAAQNFDSTLVGDASLMRRPMERVATPLRMMGAQIDLREGRAPIAIHGRGPLEPVRHTMTVPSAQVKSALILAALTASGESIIFEPLPSRDHTERMLGLQTAPGAVGRAIHVQPRTHVEPFDLNMPGDISSAAFFVVGATILPGSELRIEGVGLNPTRTAMLDVLSESGASIETVAFEDGTEPTATLLIRSSSLTSVQVVPDMVPRLVDEVPVLAVAATRADGISRFEGIAELRAKESDRIETTCQALNAMGARTESEQDSMTVYGGQRLRGSHVESHGDHRIAMAMAIAALTADGQTTIGGSESAAVSYPDFWETLESVTQR